MVRGGDGVSREWGRGRCMAPDRDQRRFLPTVQAEVMKGLSLP